MRKKQLLFQIEQLICKNTELYNDNVSLSNDIVKKDRIINDLNNQILDLENQIKSISKSSEDHAVFDEEVLSYDEQNAIDNDTEEITPVSYKAEEEPKCEDYRNTAHSIIFDDDKFSDASEAIGKAVLRCTELCNHFALIDSNNAKDLINLTLGRTEVFKSEVLQIVNSTADLSEQIELISQKYDDLIEYFNLLERQI